MDALTNVVAVLILVLILVQADVSKKVAQFLEDLQPATPEQVEKSREVLRFVSSKKESLIEKLGEEPPTPKQIEEERRRLALLEKNHKDTTHLLADLKELKELEAKIRNERDLENGKTVTIQEEIARLLALLDQTPVLEEPAPTEVTIPNSRPIPANASVYQALVVRNRVHMIDPFTLLAVFEDELKKNRRDWLIERISQKGSDRYIFDQTKIANHFKDFDFRNSRRQKVQLLANRFGTRLQLDIAPDLKKGGTAIEDLEKKGSEFSNAAAALRGDRKAVVLFHVNPDSFNAYLKARGLLDRAKIPAGWQVSGANNHRFLIPGVEVKRLEEPPPQPPMPPSKPGPRPLGPKLD